MCCSRCFWTREECFFMILNTIFNRPASVEFSDIRHEEDLRHRPLTRTALFARSEFKEERFRTERTKRRERHRREESLEKRGERRERFISQIVCFRVHGDIFCNFGIGYTKTLYDYKVCNRNPGCRGNPQQLESCTPASTPPRPIPRWS